ncbi:hypothetical protein [Xenorhabdus khoisanae]|nr:hypothetical protein [Xenorhabdus khoisanae]
MGKRNTHPATEKNNMVDYALFNTRNRRLAMLDENEFGMVV